MKKLIGSRELEDAYQVRQRGRFSAGAPNRPVTLAIEAQCESD